MATYQIRGLPTGAIGAFKERCRDGGVDPDELLRAVIEHTDPKRDEAGNPVVMHALTFHQYVRQSKAVN